MKKFYLAVLCFVMFVMGCTGLNTAANNPAINVVTDTAFVLVLQNNPQYKPVVVAALQNIKILLNGKLTYDQLIAEITKLLPGEYAVVGVMLTAYIAADKPISETYLSMFDAYKAGVIVKIDRFLMLAGA